MGISYPSASASPDATIVITTVTPSTAGSTIAAANANRLPGAMILNKASQVVSIAFSADPTNVSPGGTGTISIPANGGTYDLPANYRGAIVGVAAAASTGTLQFIEPRS